MVSFPNPKDLSLARYPMAGAPMPAALVANQRREGHEEGVRDERARLLLTLDGELIAAIRTHVDARQEQHEIPTPPFKLVRCPDCNQPPEGTCDTIPGVAYLSIDVEAGTMEFAGETRIAWDGQTTEINDKGDAEFWCNACDKAFHGRLEAASSLDR